MHLPSLLALALAAWFVPVAHSAAIILTWDANTEPDVAGYRLYYDTPPGDYAVADDVGNVTHFTVADLELGKTYAFYVTCYDTSGRESEPSNILQCTVPDPSSLGPTLSSVKLTRSGVELIWPSVPGSTYRVLYSDDLKAAVWRVGPADLLAAGPSLYWLDTSIGASPQRFYAVEVSSFASTLGKIAVTPASPTISVGATQQFTATGTYSDGSTQNVTSGVTWSSSSPAVATVTPAGSAAGVVVGSVTISASLNGLTGSATLSVQPLPPAVTTATLTNGRVGGAYSAVLSASGGTLPYTWSLAN